MTPSQSISAGLAALTLSLAAGCGSGGSGNAPGTSGASGATGSGGGVGSGGSAATGGGPAAGGGTGAGGASGGSPGGGAGGSPAGGGGGASAAGGAAPGAGGAATCTTPDAWDVTYDLDGSTFEIRDTPLGAGNQVNTCTAPYTGNDQIGPGTLVLRFPDSGGAPGPGPVHVMAYEMDLEFTVGGATTVHTQLAQHGVPTTCGAASGTYAGTAITWADPGLNMRTNGTVTCVGTLCSLGGLPDGTPQAQDDTSPQALVDFTLSNGVGSFVMAAVLNTQDSTSSEWMTFKGAETGRKAVCDCP